MQEFLVNLWNDHSQTVLDISYNAILAIAILVACSMVAKLVKKSITKAGAKFEKLDPTLLPVLSTIASYVVYIIGGVFILDIFGVNTASVIALLGAAGLAVGFALKDTLSNIAAGIMILFLRPFKSGDAINVAGMTGSVKEINLFTTTLQTPDGLYIAAPNSVIWGSSITNFTRNGKRRMDIVVGIDYGDDINVGLEVLRKIAANETRFLQDPAPMVMVASLGDSSVNLQLRAWATLDDYWQTLWDMNKLCKEEIEAAGLSIPFPQRTVHMIAPEQMK